ncbi:MAG: rod shape-determining protein MreC [Candidatus Margulisiibacteriota bacterium]
MRSRIAYFLLILAVFLLNFPQAAKSPPVSSVRASVQTVGYVFEGSTSYLLEKTNHFFGFIINANKFEKANLALKEKLERAEAELLVLQKIENENQALRSALGFKASNPYGFHLLPAEVIGRGGDEIAVVINKGETDGVKAEQTVINRSGLVGRVIEVTKYSSKVSLITDSMNVVSAILLKTGTYGVIRGGGRLTMDYVPSSVSVEVGERAVVSNSSSVFLRGLPIGTVRSANKKVEDLFQKVEIEPAVDFSKLDVLYICQP